MLAADAHLETGPRLAPTLHADLHQLADAVAINRNERIDLENAARDVGAEEARCVVAADAECGLRQIVGAEREELGLGGDPVGQEGGTRQL